MPRPLVQGLAVELRDRQHLNVIMQRVVASDRSEKDKKEIVEALERVDALLKQRSPTERRKGR